MSEETLVVACDNRIGEYQREWTLTIGEYLDVVKWYEEQIPVVRAVIDRVPPGSRWQMKGQPGSYYVPVAYAEDGTVTMTRWYHGTPVVNIFGMVPGMVRPYQEDKSWGVG